MSTTAISLAAELAVGASRRLQATLAHDQGPPGFFFHSFQGPFDEACHVLWELDVALADPGGGGRGVPWADRDQHANPASFSFLSATETRAQILSREALPEGLLDRLLTAFIGVACDYGPTGSALSVEREPFQPQAEYEREIGALIECGYVERCGTLVKWTDKVAPAMQEQHLWDSAAAPPSPRLIGLSADAQRRVAALLQQGQRIAAVVVIREDAGATIGEAMRHLDEIERFGLGASTIH